MSPDRSAIRQLERDLERAEKIGTQRPSPEQEDAALAALSGTITEARPDTGLQRNLLRLRLVLEAQANGASWQMIGQALGGISGKAAKRQMKLLAANTQRQLLAAKGAHPPADRPWVHELGETHGPELTVTGPGVCHGRECDC